MDYSEQYCMRFPRLRVLIYQGLPLALGLGPCISFCKACGSLWLCIAYFYVPGLL